MNVALILNYKAATETISCAESLLLHCRELDHVILVDNDSQDGSVDAFRTWHETKEPTRSTVLANPQNNGYAGGNNFGLEWARANLDVDYFWVVNNDTYVDSDALAPLLAALRVNDNQFVGSAVLSSDTGKLECFGGGKLYPLLGKARLLGKGQTVEAMIDSGEQPDYVMGCSMAFSSSLIDRVGVMDETYFMYSEEVDWQFRAKRHGVGIRVVPQSRVYHYGSLSSNGGRSAFYHYYRNRAATRFNKRFYGPVFALASACFLSAITVAKEIRHPALAWSGIKGAFKGVTMSVK